MKWKPGRNLVDNKIRAPGLPTCFDADDALLGMRAQQKDYANEIRTAQAQGRYSAAAELYRKLIDSGTDSPEIRSNYGVMLQMAGKSRAATEQFQVALHANPNLAAANLFNGLAELDLGRTKQAIPYLERAAQLDQVRPEPELSLGRAYAALRDFKSANDAYVEAAKRDRNSAEAWYGVGITDRSLAESELNHVARKDRVQTPETRALLDDAYKALRRAAELDPQSARVHLILERAYEIPASWCRRFRNMRPQSGWSRKWRRGTLGWRRPTGSKENGKKLCRPCNAPWNCPRAMRKRMRLWPTFSSGRTIGRAPDNKRQAP